MKLTLIRHGETNANDNKLIQGWTDNPLNEAGINQAKRLQTFFITIGEHFDVVLSSPLKRAYDTGKIALSHLKNLNIIIDYHFMERDFGVFEGKDALSMLPVILEKNFTYKGYEDDKMLLKRIENGLIHLYEKYQDKNVLIFCHSHVIKSFLIMADNKKYTYKTFIDNASIHKLTYDGERLKILEFNMTV